MNFKGELKSPCLGYALFKDPLMEAIITSNNFSCLMLEPGTTYHAFLDDLYQSREMYRYSAQTSLTFYLGCLEVFLVVRRTLPHLRKGITFEKLKSIERKLKVFNDPKYYFLFDSKYLVL